MFHRWFLAMVAQWQGRDKRFGNMLVPMLIGAQGTRKTTFCRMILPPALEDYFIDDIKMDNAEQVERVLARMALVNIDEYNSKTEREQAKIKRILAEKYVQVRKMRSDEYVRINRNASFIATTNSPVPLTDPTGSRRYICCPVSGVIDTESPVNYRQLYAQAVHELRHGARYWPSPDEEQRLQEHNQSFQQIKKSELLLTEFFEPTERKKDSLMSYTDVEESLRKRVSAASMPTVSELSNALSRSFQSGAVKGKRGWYMRPRS
jgi:predicted P-loop ATPase